MQKKGLCCLHTLIGVALQLKISGLHCTFGCATLKYSLCILLVVALKLKTLGYTVLLGVLPLKVQPMHIIGSNIEIENSRLHCTFGCATLKYSLCTLLVVALKLKTLGYTALLGVPP